SAVHSDVVELVDDEEPAAAAPASESALDLTDMVEADVEEPSGVVELAEPVSGSGINLSDVQLVPPAGSQAPEGSDVHLVAPVPASAINLWGVEAAPEAGSASGLKMAEPVDPHGPSDSTVDLFGSVPPAHEAESPSGVVELAEPVSDEELHAAPSAGDSAVD